MERFQTTSQEVEYWEKYQDPKGEVKKDSLYIYGVDYLSTKKIMEYFHYFTPSKVIWLNDTSCNVVFPSDEYALNALNSCCLEKIEDDKNFENIKRTALGYQANDEVVPIFIRFTTEGDVKSENVKAKNSKYYKWKKFGGIKNKPIHRKKRFD
jgi:hypothetical protein